MHATGVAVGAARLALGAAGLAFSAGGLAFGLGRSAISTAAALARGPGMAGLKIAEGTARWAMGGDMRVLSKISGVAGQKDIWAFNPALRRKIVGGMALYGAYGSASTIRQQQQASYYTDNELEQRRYNDLGATGGMALSMSDFRNTGYHLVGQLF